MPLPEFLLWQIVPLMLVVARVSGLFLFTPILANRLAPRRVRAMVALVMGLAVYAGLPTGARSLPETDFLGLVPLVVGELLIGAVMGFIAALPVFALDLAGFVIGHQMGLGLARVYNPEIDADTDSLGQLLMYVGLGVFVSLGGLESLFLSLGSTFERIPPGGIGAADVPLDAIVGVLTSGFELAIRVAAPALCIILLVMIAMGFMMKSMPQINVLSVGFTVQILCGLGVVTLSLWAAQQAAGDEIVRVLEWAERWGSGMSP